jgi:hypothetical protein
MTVEQENSQRSSKDALTHYRPLDVPARSDSCEIPHQRGHRWHRYRLLLLNEETYLLGARSLMCLSVFSF